MSDSRWEAYFWPGTEVLRNKLGLVDPVSLRIAEYGLTADRQTEIDRGLAPIARSYDAVHLRAIHRHLFQDLYDWAGEHRTVDMRKGMTEFAPTGWIDRYLADAAHMIERTDWPGLDRDGFAAAAAAVYAHLNQAHPFREGNGRAAKVFLQHVADRSAFTLDYERVEPPVWNQASELSGPDRGAYTPVPDSLVPVFAALAVPRTAPQRTDPDVDLGRSASRAAFPRPPSRALEHPPGRIEPQASAVGYRGYGRDQAEGPQR